MNRVLLVMLSAMLAGCGKPDVQQCEAYIKSSLRSPSSYRRLSLAAVDGPMPVTAASKKRAGPRNVNDEYELLQAEMDKINRPSLREMAIQYEADNAYGTPVRGAGVCAFRLINGSLEDAEQIEARRKRSELADNLDELAAAGIVTTGARRRLPQRRLLRGYGCCL